ncbi:hypothetical protein ACIQMP_23170 [Streptomyces sp. NPDC091385]|uniref:hypothetical protein n=1 Tax=Streptomyces sp. NPDC091385 TaxID=3365997 RepID=UPI003812F7D5
MGGEDRFDPVVSDSQFEAIMTDCGYEEARGRPQAGHLLSEPAEEAEAFVVSLTNTLATALARFAELWSKTDELRQIGMSVEVMAGVLEVLAGLARRAHASNRRLYCWWAL